MTSRSNPVESRAGLTFIPAKVRDLYVPNEDVLTLPA